MNEESSCTDQKLLRKASSVRPDDEAIPRCRTEYVKLGRNWEQLIDSLEIARIEPSKLAGIDVFNQSQRENDLLLKIARDLTRYLYRHVLKLKQPPESPLNTLTPAAETSALRPYTD
jgi:hypothetical protein